MKTNIFVIGFPKTGTIWLARLLGDAMDCPVSTLNGGNGYPTEGQNRQSCYVIRHGHANPRQLIRKFWMPEDKIAYIVRDPRDVTVSAMYYFEDSCIQESIVRITNPHKAGAGISRHFRGWQQSGMTIANTRYEKLLDDTFGDLSRMLCELNLISVNDIAEVVRRQSFDQRKQWTEKHGDELVFGKEKQLAFLRKGIAGDWKNHFTQRDALLMQEKLGDFMIELGYIQPDECWWKGLPQ